MYNTLIMESQIVGELRIYCFHEHLCIGFCFAFNLSLSESDASSGECCLSCAEYGTECMMKLLGFFKVNSLIILN